MPGSCALLIPAKRFATIKIVTAPIGRRHPACSKYLPNNAARGHIKTLQGWLERSTVMNNQASSGLIPNQACHMSFPPTLSTQSRINQIDRLTVNNCANGRDRMIGTRRFLDSGWQCPNPETTFRISANHGTRCRLFSLYNERGLCRVIGRQGRPVLLAPRWVIPLMPSCEMGRRLSEGAGTGYVR